MAVKNFPVQALFGGHAFGGISRGGLFGWRDRFKIFDVALQGIGAAVEDQVFASSFSSAGMSA